MPSPGRHHHTTITMNTARVQSAASPPVLLSYHTLPHQQQHQQQDDPTKDDPIKAAVRPTTKKPPLARALPPAITPRSSVLSSMSQPPQDNQPDHEHPILPHSRVRQCSGMGGWGSLLVVLVGRKTCSKVSGKVVGGPWQS